ncbi:MAG: AbrB/MazE/SpoVT family DNA-binding domain-containing protein [Betaproteobacteria bacterium]|nr:AbrB/MazE/SpoVT family DNA-binding domain-containing protein [Betaproteobacteria bacterium]NDE42161.1 AbrB/MazE/SpoVT family DNA-binding domain-containing protein [Betaproteobacteria bacterium]NDE73959.1 AbrB/MazE/SpoVT family DNA-binding domain-containing protein [Betaproteobacteria bacterium]
MATLALPTAKIFTTGRSQAVRLPKAFRFNTPEVTIERQGDAIILRPKVQSKEEWWDDMEKILASFEGMPEEIERDRSGLSDPVSFD